MREYDPDRQPDPERWLELAEDERIRLADAYHLAERIPLPNRKVHAAFHVIVENQIAGNVEPVVRAMKRLTGEGLSRHEALHAIGSVLTDLLWEASRRKVQRSPEEQQRRYDAAVDRLTARSWRKRHGER